MSGLVHTPLIQSVERSLDVSLPAHNEIYRDLSGMLRVEDMPGEQRASERERGVMGLTSAFGSNVSQVSERNVAAPWVEGGARTTELSPESHSYDSHIVAEAVVREADGVAIESLQPGTRINRQRAAEADLRKSFGLEEGEVRTRYVWTMTGAQCCWRFYLQQLLSALFVRPIMYRLVGCSLLILALSATVVLGVPMLMPKDVS